MCHIHYDKFVGVFRGVFRGGICRSRPLKIKFVFQCSPYAACSCTRTHPLLKYPKAPPSLCKISAYSPGCLSFLLYLFVCLCFWLLSAHIIGCLLATVEGMLLVGTVTGTLQLWSIEGNATPSETPPKVTLKAKMDVDIGRITSACFNKSMQLVRDYCET